MSDVGRHLVCSASGKVKYAGLGAFPSWKNWKTGSLSVFKERDGKHKVMLCCATDGRGGLNFKVCARKMSVLSEVLSSYVLSKLEGKSVHFQME